MFLPRRSATSTLLKALFVSACLFGAGTRTGTTLARSMPARAQETTAQGPSSSAAAVKPPVDDTARGVQFYQQSKYKEAVKLLRAVTKKNKEDAEAWLYLGLSHLRLDEMKKAREALQTARGLRPKHGVTLNALAVMLVRSGDEYEALQAATEAAKHAPQNVESHYLLGAINYRSGRFVEALAGAEAALKINASFPSAHYLKGQALLGLSDQALTNSRNETPDVRSMLSEKADARFTEAVQTLETFMRLAPNAPEVPLLR